MCGRYTLTEPNRVRFAERFGVDAGAVPEEALARFNVCPSEAVVAIAPGPRAQALRWGIEPARSGGLRINARAETAGTQRLWARLLARARSRCLVPADGWYEWLRPEAPGAPRAPLRYTVDGGALFAFAALRDDAGVAILTTAANTLCAPVHDRMPCVLAGPDAEAAWLSEDVDAVAATELLAPLPAGRCAVAPANPAVNRAGVEGPHLLVPQAARAPVAAPALTLFE